MTAQIDELESKALQELTDIDRVNELDSWRVRYLGKKGALTTILRSLSSLSLEERKAVGSHANEVKKLLEHSSPLTAKKKPWTLPCPADHCRSVTFIPLRRP